MIGDPEEILPDRLPDSTGASPEQEQRIDLEKLAEKILEKLLQELSIENERMGY